MLIWIILAVMTFCVVVVLVRPLVGRRSVGQERAAHDIAVYRDQLRELESELERGLIDPGEAEAARTEISRRLLARAEDGTTVAGEEGRARRASSVAMFAAVVAVPAIALPLYLTYGSPQFAGTHQTAEVPDEQETETATNGEFSQDRIDSLIRQVEERLAANPNDGRGWDVIAPVYMRQNRFEKAADAYARAGRLLGESAARLSGFAEARVLAENGIVSKQAESAFKRSLELEPRQLKPRFWLAMAKEQDGDLAGAAADYRALLERGDADARWRPLVADRLERARQRLGSGEGRTTAAGESDPARADEAQPRPGPSQDDVAAAQSLSPEERRTMIGQMVSRLAARLEKDGEDLDGWLRLMRSYTVLGQQDDARAALEASRNQFAGNEAALRRINALARELGLDS